MKDTSKNQDIHISSVYSDNENLVDLLENQHGLTLLETDINDILHAVKQDRNTAMKDPEFIKLFEGVEEEKETYTKEDMEMAYRAGENKQTYYFKDTTVILPTTYEGVEG